jgi:hypothetical protein
MKQRRRGDMPDTGRRALPAMGGDMTDEWRRPTLKEPGRLDVMTELQQALEAASPDNRAFVLTCLEDAARRVAERSQE